MRREQLIRRLLKTTETMLQGDLSESSRRCGSPTCICHRDPQRLHGPHLYITYRVKGQGQGQGRSFIYPFGARRVRPPGTAGVGLVLGDRLRPRCIESREAACSVPTRQAQAQKRPDPWPEILMIETRRPQLSFGDGLINAEITDLREDWMTHADQVLEDEQLLTSVYEALMKRHPKSRTRGRLGMPAEVVLRLLILKHIRNWSYNIVEREVRANLVYRDFTRVGGGKVPDSKTMGRWGVALGPEVIQKIHERIIEIARENKIVEGRKMRLDTTVVETNIHYPTDSSLWGDGVRVLIRTMKKVTDIAGDVGAKLRDRSRSVKLRVLEIARAARSKGEQRKERLKKAYEKLVDSTSRVVGQAKRFAQEIADGVKRSADGMQQAALDGFKQELETFALAPFCRGSNR